MPAQRGKQRESASLTGSGQTGLSVDLVSRALYTGLIGIVAMLLLSSIADPLFRLLDLDADPRAYVHRLHDLGVFVHSLLLLVAPLLLSFREPEARPALMVLALAGAVITFATSLAHGAPDLETLRFVGLLGFLALLHPSRRHLLRVGTVSWPLLALALLATVPWTAYGVVHIEFDRAAVGPVHGSLGHWQIMAGLGFTIAFGAVYAALRPAGWRAVACLSGLATSVIGFISLVWPRQASSLGPWWGVAAMVWGVAFCVLGEVIARRGQRPPPPAETVPQRVPSAASR